MRPVAPALLAIVVLAAALSPGATSAQPAPAPTPLSAPETPVPTAPPQPPTAAPLPTPSGTPSPSPSPSSSPMLAPNGSPYRFVVTPPPPGPGKPAILEIDMMDQTLHVGGAYSVRVKTSIDVTTLLVSTMGNTYGMQGAGPGLFASDGTVPGFVPFFFVNRNYDLVVTAQTADKRSTSFTLTLRLEK